MDVGGGCAGAVPGGLCEHGFGAGLAVSVEAVGGQHVLQRGDEVLLVAHGRGGVEEVLLHLGGEEGVHGAVLDGAVEQVADAGCGHVVGDVGEDGVEVVHEGVLGHVLGGANEGRVAEVEAVPVVLG